MRPWHISILIPARNEEDLLPRCLSSVFNACSELPAPVSWDIVVAVDASTDKTASIAERMLGSNGAVVLTDAGMVGRARAAAVQTALARHRGVPQSCWLAHTDADCVVPNDWLIKQLLLADQGIEAIAGIIAVDSFREHSLQVSKRFRASYCIRSDGTHPHVHGANLGVRADAYTRSGGWNSLATGEDHDLWGRLRLTGCSMLSTDTVKVITSGRRIGRAPHGFAEALAAHNEANA